MKCTPMDADVSGDGWHFDVGGRPGRRWIFVVAAVLLLAVAVPPLRVGQYVIPALLAGGSIVMLIPFFLRPREQMQTVRYDGLEGRGLLLPTYPMRKLAVIGFASFGALLVVAGLWVAFTALREDQLGMLVGTVIALVLGGLVLSGAWFGLRGRMLANQGVLLTENGISLLSDTEPLIVYWPALTDVRAHWTRGSLETQARLALKQKGSETFRNWLSFQATDFSGKNPQAPFARTNDPTVSADDLGVDPHTVLAVCRYYLEHPEARPELATTAALERVRSLAAPQSEES